jgi:hypothetical protein
LRDTRRLSRFVGRSFRTSQSTAPSSNIARRKSVSGLKTRSRTACGSDSANSGGPPSAFVTGSPDMRFPAHIAERFTFIGICQLLWVVCKASQFQAHFTLREETNNNCFFATAGRTAEKLGQCQKLSQRELRQFKLIPALGLKIVHEFDEQRLVGFSRSYPLL